MNKQSRLRCTFSCKSHINTGIVSVLRPHFILPVLNGLIDAGWKYSGRKNHGNEEREGDIKDRGPKRVRNSSHSLFCLVPSSLFPLPSSLSFLIHLSPFLCHTECYSLTGPNPFSPSSACPSPSLAFSALFHLTFFSQRRIKQIVSFSSLLHTPPSICLSSSSA